MQRIPAKEYRKMATNKRTKYGNQITIIDGISFDSKAEAKYYEQLKWLKQGKRIKGFKLQPRYILQDGFVKNGKKYRKIEYVADFEVHKLDGTIEVIDIKGVETKEFTLKRKLFEAKYLDTLSVLAYHQHLGFIELDKLKKLKKKKS
jgi:hypothetical protein